MITEKSIKPGRGTVQGREDELPGETEPVEMVEPMDILSGDSRMKEMNFDTFLAVFPLCPGGNER